MTPYQQAIDALEHALKAVEQLCILDYYTYVQSPSSIEEIQEALTALRSLPGPAAEYNITKGYNASAATSRADFAMGVRQTYYGGEMSKFTDRIDMRFQYVPAIKTDIRKTIAKELRRLAKESEKQKTTEFKAQVKVL